jgi:hypothetical protein
MERELSNREWYGMLAAAGWGAVLGLVPFDKFGVLGLIIVVLAGPPLAFLVLPKRPFLSWQLCVIAAAVSGAFMDRDPEEPSNAVVGSALLEWTALALFSLPWPFILYRRAQRARVEGDSSTGVTIPYIGVGLLVFLAFGLIVLGSILAVFGILNPAPSDRATALDRVVPFIGCVLTTVGIGLAVFLCRRTGELQANKIVEELIGLLLAFLAVMLIPIVWMGTFNTTPCPPGDQSCNPARGSDLFWAFVISAEAIPVLVWLIRRGRRAREVERAA